MQNLKSSISVGRSGASLAEVLSPLCSPLKEAVEHLLKSVNSALARDPERASDHMCQAASLLNLNPLDLRAVALITHSDTNSSGCVRGGLARWQIRRIVNYIEENLEMRRVRMEDLAGLINLSPSHFSRAFRRSLGHSPRTFVIRRRVAKAQRLMLGGEIPLSQIAILCGFSDQSHFSRTFHKNVGESPGAWRRARSTQTSAILDETSGETGHS
jgi:AraC-like DNA-binding protein